MLYSLSVGFGDFVKTQTTSGKVGAAINILGTGPTGSTEGTFNGTGAVFTVVSDAEISTTGPTDVTNGRIEVTTPAGTFKSNKNFTVRPCWSEAQRRPQHGWAGRCRRRRDWRRRCTK
jgi:hypothetical protein